MPKDGFVLDDLYFTKEQSIHIQELVKAGKRDEAIAYMDEIMETWFKKPQGEKGEKEK